MGNYDIRPIGGGPRFRQSLTDFPLTVDLGREVPEWGLTRWGKAGAVPPLRFRPPVDEAYSLRGDKRQLLYKGREKSHRFTILRDGAFEYDCILKQEPLSSVVCIGMEGAECYDFFRQPDFLKNPFLAGSYAVYKKETLIGEGTGKLCHIHRPKIVDSRGRWVWGDLSIAGDTLVITIPEGWLADAAYPVVVDPVIGTTTVGSLPLWDDEEDDWDVDTYLACEYTVPVNRFLVPQAISGTLHAFAYSYYAGHKGDGGYPMVFSDLGRKPKLRKSKLEERICFDADAEGWFHGDFAAKETLAAGSYIWFGISSDQFYFPRYDYGGADYDNYDNEIELQFSHYQTGISARPVYTYKMPDEYPIDGYENGHNLKYSFYFTDSAAQGYLRTLAQGVTLHDSRKLTAAYKKTLLSILTPGDAHASFFTLIRHIAERVSAFTNTGHAGDYFRKQTDAAYSGAVPRRSLFMVIRLATVSFVRDYILKRFLKSNEDLALKSPVCREVEIESRLH
ncbi:hypothetical protein FACS189491_09260 [Spirochaetia bacterium]|nr:hypothetical protein FACS189491_09260 [Spirochaetia bacterium]